MEPYQLYLLIFVGIIVLFFVFREVNSWYWKINQRVENQEILIDLAKKQLAVLESLQSPTEKTPTKKEEVTKPIVEDDIEMVESLIKSFKPGEVIVKSKVTGRIEKLKKFDWNEIVESGNESKFDILYQ